MLTIIKNILCVLIYVYSVKLILNSKETYNKKLTLSGSLSVLLAVVLVV